MIEKPIEWRRFERVELEGDVARTAPRATGVTPATPTPPSLLREFERVLRENERLQIEVSTLRAEVERSNGRPQKIREELEHARAELDRLDSGPASIPFPSADAPSDASKPRETTSEDSEVATQPENVARVVAGYIFPDPTEAHVRLVTDALRARGIASNNHKA